MNMNWLNIKYIGRAGLIIILLFFTCPSSATCKTDTVISTYKRDSLYFAVKADSIIAFHTGDSLFTIIKADTVLPVIPKAVKRTGYDNRVHRFRKNWERIIPTHAKIQYAGNMGLLSFGTGWDYGKRNQWETDILLGFIPKYSSKKTKVTMTLKQNYMPCRLLSEASFAASTTLASSIARTMSTFLCDSRFIFSPVSETPDTIHITTQPLSARVSFMPSMRFLHASDSVFSQ